MLFRPHGSRLLMDPRDTRVGEKGECRGLALAGVPWDWNTGGDPGARHAPRGIVAAIMGRADYSPRLGPLNCRPVLVGDIAVVPGDWAETRRRIAEAARRLLEEYRFTLYVGGDHSITGAILEGIAPESGGCLGLLMLDAHYDMRSIGEGVTSGSWLWDTLEYYKDGGVKLEAVIVGIADYANPSYLAERARAAGFTVIPAHRAEESPESVLDAVDRLAGSGCTRYYVTVDMDHIAEAYAPGVNSPSPLGMSPHTTARILVEAFGRLRPVAADITEVVPVKDPTGSTVRLAAHLGLLMLHASQRLENA